VYDLEASRMRRPWTALGHSVTGKKKLLHSFLLLLVKGVYVTVTEVRRTGDETFQLILKI
jgi:hypothetical protein